VIGYGAPPSLLKAENLEQISHNGVVGIVNPKFCSYDRGEPQLVTNAPVEVQDNVRGEPVFSVMVAGWFCEMYGCIVKVEDVKPVLLELKMGVQPATILRRRIFTRMNYEIDGFHLV
jgi:hypothetical protein